MKTDFFQMRPEPNYCPIEINALLIIGPADFR